MLFRRTKAQELWNLSLCPKPVQGFSMVLEENVTFLFDVLDNRATQESPLLWVHNAEEEATLWLEVNKQVQCLTRQSSTLEVCERWSPPLSGVIKCNVHVNWRNGNLRCSLDHARPHCARDLHFTSVSIASDHLETIETISAPSLWPRFRALLEQINSLGAFFVRYRLKSRKYTLI
ncbi:hypothetical protein F2Q68_00014906 [Brassica cretica]|uniref:Uncharacterized protein n=1 Tax=Brassica cretica TaxID=69181 RepID=A0A8S9HAS8_BRACR|nr:hypothetical protein F2Q68_00014906 [Brassica cretica]